MPVITWKAVYETGIVALDNEHRQLIAQVNRLYEALRDKRSDEVLGDILAVLELYTVDHFSHEEKLMAAYNFPELEEHRRHHGELIEAVAELKNGATDDTGSLAAALLKLLRHWVLDHIVEVDKKYGAYLESRAGRFVT
jgi:hemerythrin